jgi:hypothetical protein
MLFVGLGLHFLVALFFAVHAVRSRREMYWLIVLFGLPLVGSIVYLVAVYLPQSRLDRGVNTLAHSAIHVLDPERQLREAEDAFELSPSAQNEWRLAGALLDCGYGAEANRRFDALLRGPLGQDPELRFAAARAKLQCGEAARAIDIANQVRETQPDFRQESISLLIARALAASGRTEQARQEFAGAVERFGTVETRAAYAVFAATSGDVATARALREQIERDSRHWNRHARELNQPLMREIDDALAMARGSG